MQVVLCNLVRSLIRLLRHYCLTCLGWKHDKLIVPFTTINQFGLSNFKSMGIG